MCAGILKVKFRPENSVWNEKAGSFGKRPQKPPPPRREGERVALRYSTTEQRKRRMPDDFQPF
ncbi:MAG: hypothetical protein C5B47_06750 [Verrucomicrobia bacterium]|nr:MAG: hypothetical protein C5B47_06750 [Verrucomicrobiota bacterium]